MREIKFRAWRTDEDGGYMVDSPRSMATILERHMRDYPATMNPGWSDHVATVTSDDYILMQYTGLKDKNGRQIYEGDVVIHPESKREAKSLPYTVEWYGSGFCTIHRFKDPDSGREVMQWSPLSDSYREIEVIGNIYENPELLSV